MATERISGYSWRSMLKGVLGDDDGRVGSSGWRESALQELVRDVEKCW